MVFIMKTRIIYSVILLCLCVLTFVEVEGWDDKVLLEKIQALTLYRGKYTTGRRHRPIKQMECTGGDAGCRYEPDVIQCRNIGLDGTNPNWKCEATLPKSLKFGRLKVTCEGYDFPNDQYVLKGSCGLKYTLYFTNDYPNDYNDYPNDRKRKRWLKYDKWLRYDDKSKLFSTLFGITWLSIMGYIFYNVYLAFMRTRREDNRPTYQPRTDDVPYHHDYDSSPSSTRRESRRGNTSHPGLWTGVLGGGLLGYLFGRRNNNNNYIRTRRRREREPSPSYSSSSYSTRDYNDDYDYSSSSHDNDTYTAYGFADTETR